MGRISLDGMEFWGYHGCFEEEAIVGNRFSVSVMMDVDTSVAEESDDVADTLNYVEVYRLIGEEMGRRSHLLEHVARRMVDGILSRFDRVFWVRVSVCKHNPPIGGSGLGRVCVELEGRRDA